MSDLSDGPSYACEHGVCHDEECKECESAGDEAHDTEETQDEQDSRPMEAQVIDMVMTAAVRKELHTALDGICDSLRDTGKLGSMTTFELVPGGGQPGQDDTLSVSMQVMLLPLLDGKPCGYFKMSGDVGREVH